VIDEIPTGRPVSVERETFPGLLEASRKISAVVDPGYWLDLGTPLAFVQGSVDLVRGIAPSPAVVVPGDSLMLAGAEVNSSSVISGGTTLGTDSRVGANSLVDGSVVFDGAQIGANSTIRNSIIGAGAVVGDHCIIEGCVIGDNSSIGNHNELREGVRVWVNSVIPELAIRFSSDQ
jgi:mannose-1-phosphate guanylyltransferase